MPTAHVGAEIDKSALVIIDMQNDFVHSDGRLAHRARENPDAKIDMPFLMGTIPHVKRMPRFPSGVRPEISRPGLVPSSWREAGARGSSMS